MSYIEQKVKEFENKFIEVDEEFGGFPSFKDTMDAEEAKEFLKEALTSLLLKCKEAVGEERKQESGDLSYQDWNVPYTEGYNDHRSTTLQNLDKLK